MRYEQPKTFLITQYDPFAGRQKAFKRSEHLLGILLVSDGQLCHQPHHLLPDERKVGPASLGPPQLGVQVPVLPEGDPAGRPQAPPSTQQVQTPSTAQ